MLLISVITPCFNAAAYLRDAIDSVLNQTHKNIELILVNDGSTDETEAIIKSYSDERIRYYYQENKGQCAASNFGLSVAKGDYIKFFDADDVMNDTHLEAQLKKLNGRTNAVSSCAWGRFYDHNPLSARFIPESVWKDMKPLQWLKLSLQQPADMMGGWLWLIPQELIKKAGGWNEGLSLNNDFEFSTRLLLHAEEVLFTPDAKVFYRSGNQTLSVAKTEAAYRAAFLSTNLGCSYLLNSENSLEMKMICANRYQQWIYRIYPNYPSLLKEMETEVQKLGGSNIKMEGGVTFKLLMKLFGWRAARRIQLYFYKAGYRP